MRNQHKLILSNDELLNSKLRDELISNLKKEGFLSRKIFFYKKGIKEELNNDNLAFRAAASKPSPLTFISIFSI